MTTTDLSTWAAQNPEAAAALVAGKACVVPRSHDGLDLSSLTYDSMAEMFFCGQGRLHLAGLDTVRLDKPLASQKPENLSVNEACGSGESVKPTAQAATKEDGK